MLNWLFGKKLEDVLNETKLVKVKGVAFRIKKINALDYAMGYHVIRQIYDTYKSQPTISSIDDPNMKKLKEAIQHALVASVVSPKLSFKDNEPNTIFIDKLFVDWEMINLLYQEVIEYTYGKKKVNRFLLLAIKLLNLMRSPKDTV